MNTAYAARHLRMRSGMMFSTSGTLASMGAGLLYAIAAKLAHPVRQVVSVVGDGGFTMLMGEMATARKYGADIKVVAVARGFGWNAHAVRDPRAVAGVLAQALSEPGPSLVEIEVDQNDPLLPPKIKAKQALNLAKGLLRGTPGRETIVKNAVEDFVRETV